MTPNWLAGFASLEAENVEPIELPTRGTVPRGLEGTLYRIGPGRMEIYGERLRHWFDGDGMMHSLSFRDGRVTYRNRFVATPGKAEEDRAQRRVFRRFGTRGPGNVLDRWRTREPRNPANTHIVMHGGRLMALCEAGRAFRIDPETLATNGEESLGGVIGPDDGTFSAHPKLDPLTGEMWNFGIVHGRKVLLSLYRVLADGTTLRRASLALPFSGWIHDFALTREHIVVIVSPLALPAFPIGLISGQRTIAEQYRWRPELGTQIAVIHRVTGEVRWHATDPMVVLHIVNAWEDAGEIVVDLTSASGAVLEYLSELMIGRVRHHVRSRVERVRIQRSGAVTRSPLTETALELPRVAPAALLKEHTRIYGVAWNDGEDMAGTPVAVDTASGRSRRARIDAAREFAGECVPVAKPGATADEEVWLLTLVLDCVSRTTELRILDGADIAAPAVATVQLPHCVPFGFHGNWVRTGAEASVS